MKTPDLPTNERARQTALDQLRILDTLKKNVLTDSRA